MTWRTRRVRCKVGNTVHEVSEETHGVVFTSCLEYFDWEDVVSHSNRSAERTEDPVNCIMCLPYVS